MIQVLQIQVAVSDEQMIANWMPLSAAGLIRELCSLTLSRQLPVAAPNPCVFSKNPSFEFLNSCRLALLPGQNGVANRTPDVAGTQHRVSHGRQVAEPAVFAEVRGVSQPPILPFDGGHLIRLSHFVHSPALRRKSNLPGCSVTLALMDRVAGAGLSGAKEAPGFRASGLLI